MDIAGFACNQAALDSQKLWFSWDVNFVFTRLLKTPPIAQQSGITQETVKKSRTRSLVNFRDSNNCLKSFSFEVKWNPI